LVIGHWSLVIGHWSLVIGHWSLVIGHFVRLKIFLKVNYDVGYGGSGLCLNCVKDDYFGSANLFAPIYS
jgi:hypothetical protein